MPTIKKVCTEDGTWRRRLFSGKSIKISQTKVQRKFAPTWRGSVMSNSLPSGGKKPLIKAKISDALIIHQITNRHFGQPSDRRFK